MPNYNSAFKQILLIVFCFLVIGGQTTVSTIQDDTSKFTSAARAFVELLRTENFKAAVAQFDDTMKAAMPEAKLHEVWTAIVNKVGVFKSAGTRAQKRGEYVAVIVTCEFETTPLEIHVAFDQSTRVAGLFFAQVPLVEYLTPSYVKLDAFREKEITVGQGEWALPGTLTVPSGPGPFPAVILVHGSFKLYPALNHLFISGTGRSTPSEYAQAGHVDEQVIADIAAWIKTIRV